MANRYDLTGKIVLITGADGQIGRALSLAFLANGAFVYAIDLKKKPNQKYIDSLGELRKNYIFVSGDIKTTKSIESILRKASRSIDILINCAGIGVYTPLEKRTEKELDDVMATNLKGTILMSKAVMEKMKTRRKGTIINFGSIYGITTPDFRIYGNSGRNSSEIYGATKAGIIHFTSYLAVYLAKFGITVNAISPGGVARAQDPSFVRKYEKKTPLARMATTDDLVGTVLFLASSDARYITGQNIAVDGGFTLW